MKSCSFLSLTHRQPCLINHRLAGICSGKKLFFSTWKLYMCLIFTSHAPTEMCVPVWHSDNMSMLKFRLKKASLSFWVKVFGVLVCLNCKGNQWQDDRQRGCSNRENYLALLVLPLLQPSLTLSESLWSQLTLRDEIRRNSTVINYSFCSNRQVIQ